ncbi:hypothetical protein ZWY2020_003914 [Hordeum vulgare]|nr:hypothetical protein ZWY2020_003914 [Hordeum vulgare]
MPGGDDEGPTTFRPEQQGLTRVQSDVRQNVVENKGHIFPTEEQIVATGKISTNASQGFKNDEDNQGAESDQYRETDDLTETDVSNDLLCVGVKRLIVKSFKRKQRRSTVRKRNLKTKHNRLSLTLGGCIYQLVVRFLDFTDFGAIQVPSVMQRICVWKGSMVKNFTDMFIDENGMYTPNKIKDESETCYAQESFSWASTTKNSNLRAAIDRTVGNFITEKVKEDIFASFQFYMRDENVSTRMKAKNLLLKTLQLVTAATDDSQKTEKLESSDNNHNSADEFHWSGSTMKVNSDGVCVEDEAVNRKSKRVKQVSEQSVASIECDQKKHDQDEFQGNKGECFDVIGSSKSEDKYNQGNIGNEESQGNKKGGQNETQEQFLTVSRAKKHVQNKENKGSCSKIDFDMNVTLIADKDVVDDLEMNEEESWANYLDKARKKTVIGRSRMRRKALVSTTRNKDKQATMRKQKKSRAVRCLVFLKVCIERKDFVPEGANLECNLDGTENNPITFLDDNTASPDVQILSHRSFKQSCNNGVNSSDDHYNTKLMLGSTTNFSGKENRAPKRIVQPSKYLCSPYDQQDKGPIMEHEVKLYKNILVLSENDYYTSELAIEIDRDNHPRTSHRHYFFRTAAWRTEEGRLSFKDKATKSFIGAGKARPLELSNELFFPSFHERHWFVFLVDLKAWMFIFLDSKYEENNMFHKNIKDMMIDNFIQTWCDSHLRNMGFSQFQTTYPALPKQDDSDSCGIFTLMKMQTYRARNPMQTRKDLSRTYDRKL